MDKPTENAHARLGQRSEVGLQTYGVDLDRDDLSLMQWAEHMAEEASDAAKYAEKVVIEAGKAEARIEELTTELQHDYAQLEAWKALAERVATGTRLMLHHFATDEGPLWTDDVWRAWLSDYEALNRQVSEGGEG